MSLSTHRGGFFILLTFCAAILLMILPLPEEVRLLRPQWVTLVLIYWAMALPERVGVGAAFLAGLAVDVLTGTLLGQHALELSIIAFITVQVHMQIRVFPFWQQSLAVLGLLLMQQALMLTINGAIGKQMPDTLLASWGSPFIGAALWPWLFIILRDIRRRFRIR